MDLDVRRTLALLAGRQSGLLRIADLREAGLPPDTARREVKAGRWTTVLPGVLAPAGMPISRDVLTQAAMLWLPKRAALSHSSAAACWGIHVPPEERVWVTVPWAAPQRTRGPVIVVRTRHPPDRLQVARGLRWTPADRTVVDLAQVLGARALDAALLSAVRRGVTTATAVDRATAGLAGRAGLALLRETTARWSVERESQLEDHLHADVVAVYDGPVQRQLVVGRADGRLARGDIGLAELRLLFEADGLAFHSTDAQLAADQRRDRALMAQGWQVVRFREGPLDDRARVRAEIASLIARRRREVA